MSETITIRINVDRYALNNRLGNVQTVSLEHAITELLNGAFGPEHDPHSGEIIEPAVEATFEFIS